jgi:hypothetical protein
MEYAVTEPIREFARRRKLGAQTVYDWAGKGLIETFLIGDRRHVVIASYDRLVQQLVAEQQQNGRKLPAPVRERKSRSPRPKRAALPVKPKGRRVKAAR